MMDDSRSHTRLGIVVLVGLVIAAWATACGDGAVEPVPPAPARPTSITVEPTSASLTWLGDTVAFRAEVKDQYGAVFPALVAWSSSAETVFTVDADGTVTAVANGTGTVTATFQGLSAMAAVEVSQAPASLKTVSGDGQTTDLGAVLPDPVVVRVSDAGGWPVEGATVVFTPDDGHGTADPVEAVTDTLGRARTMWTLGGSVGDQTLHAAVGSASVEIIAHTINPDRASLIALYEATDGSNWRHNDNWLTDAPLGEWYGVDVDSEGRVVRLVLRSEALTGSIPQELGNLTGLTHLRLDENRFTGPIPSELGSLTRLRELNVNGNALTGSIPPALGGLTHLERLWLNDNVLTGPIPPELGKLINLRSLGLARNNLDGPIPADLGKLTRLESLELNANARDPFAPDPGRGRPETRSTSQATGLSGQIPAELGKLTRLQTLYLDQNELAGRIPPELGALTNLRKLNLYWNALKGSIPPELGNLTRLEYLDLRHNELSGPIPPEMAKLDRLEKFYLHYAGISGDLCSSDAELRAWVAQFPMRDGSRTSNPHDNQYTDDFLPCGGAPDSRAADSGPAVRVFYAIPSDREYRQEFVNGITRTVERMRWWYSLNLDGATFQVNGDLPQLCQMPREESYYHNGVDQAWPKVFAAVNEHCADGAL